VFKLAMSLAAAPMVAIYPGGMVGITFLTIVILAIENALTSASPAGDGQ
jgi:hypothetical protein